MTSQSGHRERTVDPGVEILYEDDRFIAVAKPAGTAVAPGGGVAETETLQAQVANRIGGKAFIVHRLDRETSGVIVFAKSPASHRELSQAFEGRTVTKRYLALVDGHVRGRRGTIAEPLREFGSGRVGVDPAGREARTDWELRKRLGGADLLEVEPFTGRRHQIRVHCYAIGHPILGDTRYGAVRPVAGAPRLMLHALELRLQGPDGEPIQVRANPPPDFTAVLDEVHLGRWVDSD